MVLAKAGQTASRIWLVRDGGQIFRKRDCPAQSGTVGQSVVMTRTYTKPAKAIYYSVLHIRRAYLLVVYPAIFSFEFIDYHDKLFSDRCI